MIVVLDDPSHKSSKLVENTTRRPEAKRKYEINVIISLPEITEVVPLVRTHRKQPVSVFDVQLTH